MTKAKVNHFTNKTSFYFYKSIKNNTQCQSFSLQAFNLTNCSGYWHVCVASKIKNYRQALHTLSKYYHQTILSAWKWLNLQNNSKFCVSLLIIPSNDLLKTSVLQKKTSKDWNIFVFFFPLVDWEHKYRGSTFLMWQ